jgi:hypothetical protein
MAGDCYLCERRRLVACQRGGKAPRPWMVQQRCTAERSSEPVLFAVELGATLAAFARLLPAVFAAESRSGRSLNCVDPYGRLSSRVMSKPLLLVGACVFAASSLACGPSYDEHTIKTPNDRVREQEELAYQEEQKARTKPATEGAAPEEKDKPGLFDDKQAELEFQRATRSAETCPEVVTGAGVPHGKTAVTVTFALDGSVASATIPPPFQETRLGNCVLNAYQAIIVPPYAGERKVMTWDVNLEAKGPAKGDKSSDKAPAKKKK